MAEDRWQAARLIPTSGINGPEEAERRATSALLAVMGSVREFGTALVRPLGASGGSLATYIEVPFVLGERTVIPDGVIQTTWGSKSWTALVEVKTGTNELERAQVECYLDVAKEQGFDSVLTISNQLAPAAGVHPVEVHKAKLRRVSLHHLSWAEVLTAAVTQRIHRGVSDPDQAWILGELIRYLEHPRSGALDFADMGGTWVTVREAVAAGTLRASDKGLPELISRWEQLLRFTALRLGRELGTDVQVVISRREAGDPSLRLAEQTASLVERSVLTGSIRIPGAAASLDICADLRAGRVTVSADIDAPREGRPLTRVGWLTRQLAAAPDGLRLDGMFVGARSTTSELLRVVRENPGALTEGKRDFRAFRIAATSPLGTKRGTGRGSFIDSVLAAVDGFYEAVLQQLRPWQARAPQLPKGGQSAVEAAGVDTTPPPLDLTEGSGDIEPDDVAPGGGLTAEAVEDLADHALAEEVGNDASISPSTEVVGASPRPSSSSEDIVVWERAEERLDREREGTSSQPSDSDRFVSGDE